VKDGGPAFPRPFSEDKFNEEQLMSQKGMSLRDWFAGMALQGIVQVLHGGIRPADLLLLVGDCYGIADAMLKEKERR